MNMSLFDGKFTEEDDEYDELKDLQQKVIQLEADLLQTQASDLALREALESLKEGTLLDAAGNRNDDGLADFWHFGRASTLQKQWVYKWLNIIDKALSTPPNTSELESFVAKAVEREVEKRLGEPVAWSWDNDGVIEYSIDVYAKEYYEKQYGVVMTPLYARRINNDRQEFTSS